MNTQEVLILREDYSIFLCGKGENFDVIGSKQAAVRQCLDIHSTQPEPVCNGAGNVFIQ